MEKLVLITLFLCLFFCGKGFCVDIPEWVSESQCKKIKEDKNFVSVLDSQVKECWATLNFSNLKPDMILNAGLGYLATGNFDYLELCKRGFIYEIQRLTQKVVTGSFPKDIKDLDVFLSLTDSFSILKHLGALSWMEQEESYTTLNLIYHRFAKFSLSEESVQKLQASKNRIKLDFKPKSVSEDKGSYLLEDGDIVVFYGDSLTGGYGPSPRGIDIYPKELEKLHRISYPEKKVLFINLGKGGETIEGATARAFEISFFNPTKIFLCYGANGVLQKNFGENFLNLLSQVKKQAPQAKLFVISLPYMDDNLPLSQKGIYSLDNIIKKQTILNESLKAIQEKPVFIDILNPMKKIIETGKKKHPEYTLNEPLDGVHPYEAGATLIAYLIFLQLNGNLPAK